MGVLELEIEHEYFSEACALTGMISFFAHSRGLNTDTTYLCESKTGSEHSDLLSSLGVSDLFSTCNAPRGSDEMYILADYMK